MGFCKSILLLFIYPYFFYHIPFLLHIWYPMFSITHHIFENLLCTLSHTWPLSLPLFLYYRTISLFPDWSVPSHLFWFKASDPYVSKLLLLTYNLSSQAEGHFLLFASEDFLLSGWVSCMLVFLIRVNTSDKNTAFHFYLFHTWDYSLLCRECRECIWNADKTMDKGTNGLYSQLSEWNEHILEMLAYYYFIVHVCHVYCAICYL